MENKADYKRKKPNRLTGGRLGTRGVVAQAMLEEGASLSKVRKVTGISETTATFLRKQKVFPRAQVDAVKRSLQDKFAMKTNACLDAITPEKLQEAGLGELMRAAAAGADRAGLGPPSVIAQYHLSMTQFEVTACPSDPSPDISTATDS